jgi:hypothetical protein
LYWQLAESLSRRFEVGCVDRCALRAAVVQEPVDQSALRAAVVQEPVDQSALRAAVVQEPVDQSALRAAVVQEPVAPSLVRTSRTEVMRDRSVAFESWFWRPRIYPWYYFDLANGRAEHWLCL